MLSTIVQGTLDIAMAVQANGNTTRLMFFKNNLAEDTCFLKVMGKCVQYTSGERYCCNTRHATQHFSA